jgi:hypothetical protein
MHQAGKISLTDSRMLFRGGIAVLILLLWMDRNVGFVRDCFDVVVATEYERTIGRNVCIHIVSIVRMRYIIARSCVSSCGLRFADFRVGCARR